MIIIILKEKFFLLGNVIPGIILSGAIYFCLPFVAILTKGNSRNLALVRGFLTPHGN